MAYELDMCVTSAVRMLLPADRHTRVAYLECMLLHARALDEFLIQPLGTRADDMNRTDFAPEWNPTPDDAVTRLTGRRPLINKHLAHLTWARVEDSSPPDWPFIRVADDIVAVTRAWVEHVTADEGKRLEDPDITALPVWIVVRQAEAALAKIARPATPN